MLNYGKQSINQDDINAVIKVLQSDWLTQGPDIEVFERSVADYCKVKYAVAVTNATSALHLACVAVGVGSDDIVWTTPNTFVASANCARYCGANVDFVDIDSKTYNMSIAQLEAKLRSTMMRPKVVIPVHFSGQSCEMKEIHALAKKYNFKIIEDASHALGADYLGAKVGSCEYSDMAVFSFHAVKMITTGEGGMILTNDKELYDKLILCRSHGITRNTDQMVGETDGPWYYQQIALGFNYRMTDMQAALGWSQMDRLESFLKRRKELALRYNLLLKGLPLILPYQHPDTNTSWHIYVIRLALSKIRMPKKDIFDKMKEKGISLNLHYIPVHLQPYYQNRGFKKGDYPNSEKYYDEVLTLPLYYDLKDEQQILVVKSLRDVLNYA